LRYRASAGRSFQMLECERTWAVLELHLHLHTTTMHDFTAMTKPRLHHTQATQTDFDYEYLTLLAWSLYLSIHTMADNAAPDASRQVLSVVQELWQQQYDYYSGRPVPGFVPQPTRVVNAQQSSPPYPTPMDGCTQRPLPVTHSAQNGDSTGYGYTFHPP
jgi:hypothetical protein